MFGVTRQGFYKAQKVVMEQFFCEGIVLDAVKTIRRRQPRVGGRKLQRMLVQMGHEIGRDRLFRLLGRHKLLIELRRNYRRTTNSMHRFRKYRNLIKDKEAVRANEIFVSDITYIDTLEGFNYLVLITDLYSRKIVGWDLSRSLSIEGSQRALRMALKEVGSPEKLVHHSDRGIQFCSNPYVGILNSNGVAISMTEENHVFENAIAERVNGILKTEFLLGEKLQSFQHAYNLTKQSVKIYNEERLHTSLNYQTPAARYTA
jgi:transposase InsO family protein